jgi:hypothetical protein
MERYAAGCRESSNPADPDSRNKYRTVRLNAVDDLRKDVRRTFTLCMDDGRRQKKKEQEEGRFRHYLHAGSVSWLKRAIPQAIGSFFLPAPVHKYPPWLFAEYVWRLR